ncbi:MAG: cation transporter [Deltaproteobacteria bacterium]|nr:cation transporter [Deltaproteobacteria bacterium]
MIIMSYIFSQIKISEIDRIKNANLILLVNYIMSHIKEIRKILWITFLLNIFNAIVKIIYGHLSNIYSMEADGFHSMFDGTSNIIGLLGIWAAAKPSDEKHHYGHKKFETIATIGIAALLFLTCIEILKKAFTNLWHPKQPEVTNLTFLIIGISIAVNVFVTIYEYRKGKEYKSAFLIADSKHTLSDILASLIVLASIIAGGIGYPIIDPVAAVVIAVLIGHLGYDIVKKASDILADASPLIGKDINHIKDIAMRVKGVKECFNIRVRGRTDAVYVDCCLLVSPGMSIGDAHNAATIVEDSIKKEIPDIVDVVIHLEPQAL